MIREKATAFCVETCDCYEFTNEGSAITKDTQCIDC